MTMEIQREENKQTKSRNQTEMNTSVKPPKKKPKVQSCEGIIALYASENNYDLGLYTHYDDHSTNTKYKFGFYGE